MPTGSIFHELENLLLFPLRDAKNRKKLLVACLVGFAGFIVPVIPGIFLLGYAGLIMQSIIRDKTEPAMPEWKDLNRMFVLGLKMMGASIIYSFPALIVMMLGYGLMMLPAFIQILSHPQGYYAPTSLIGPMMIGTFGGMALFGLGFILLVPLLIAFPPMLSHVAATNSFTAAFHFTDWWRIFRSNIGGFAVALILAAGLYFMIIFTFQILYMTIILCVFIPFLMAFLIGYLTIVTYTLFGIAYREGSEKIIQPA